MGGTVANPPFGPLIVVMSHLVRSMQTQKMLDAGTTLETHTIFADEQDSKKPKQPLEKKIKISDEAIEFLMNDTLFRSVM
jgi:hypothetical protein